MKKLLKISPIMAIIALTALSALAMGAGMGAAYAASPAEFVIVGESDSDWALYTETAGKRELLSSSDYLFFEPGNDEMVASVAFVTAMRKWLEDHELGVDDYELTFELPSFQAVSRGENTINYSHLENGDFSLSAPDVASVTDPKNGKASMSGMLQYRKKTDAEYPVGNTHGSVQSVGDPLFFGRAIPVGEYMVRYVAVENFRFGLAGNLREYSVRRYSEQEFECEIAPAPAPTPSVDEVSITYGTTVGEMIPDSSGTWTFNSALSDGIGADSILTVSEEPYTLFFDYVSNDENYLPLTGLSIKATVMPREISVYIGDLHSRAGDPQVDLGKVEFLVSDLVEGDEVEDLGLEFYLTREFVRDEPGMYIIKARISDKNYRLDEDSGSRSLMRHPVAGGIYNVFRYVYDVTAQDGRQFRIYCDEFQNAQAAVTCDMSLTVRGDIPEGAQDFYYESVACYTVRFFDSLMNRIYPEGSFVAEWSGSVDGASFWARANSESGESETLVAYDGSATSVTLGVVDVEGGKATYDSVAFLKEVTIYPPENVWQWYNILLLTVCCALAVTFVALVVLALRRRRRLW